MNMRAALQSVARAARVLLRRRAHCAPSAARRSDPPAAALVAWQPLLGGVIEYGSTGFQISLGLTPKDPLYLLYDPEGRLVAYGANLTALRQIGERLASERAEFHSLSGPRLGSGR